ncbi:MAG: ABC transporter permease, partial [Gammaproteobacteria bacterium HGW-Gammaproteobacteria-7]
MTALHHKLLRDLRALRGQVVAIALVMVGGIGMMVMALSNYQALSDTRALFYGEFRFAEVFAQVERAPLALVDEVRAIAGVRAVEARAVASANLELDG